ncbi:MAG: helix-turn-helix transcriptional regulator [Priestia megaterium]
MINRLKEYRNSLGLTQNQLAEQVHVSQRTIISLEKGQYKPSILLAYRLALVFDTSVEDLFCLEENKKQEELEREKL